MKTKALTLRSGLVILSIATFLTSCQKENTQKSSEISKIQSINHTTTISLDNLSDYCVVSNDGFLDFESAENYAAFVDVLSNSSLEQINTTFSDAGFASYGSDLLTNETKNEGLQNLIFNSDGIVAIQGTLFKFDGNGEQFLTMHKSQMSFENYGELKLNNFSTGTMNRINNNGAIASTVNTENINFFDYLSENPTGNDEGGSENPPMETFRKLFGRTRETVVICEAPLTTGTITKWWLFGICVSTTGPF